MTTLVKGSNLRSETKKEVLSAFVYRNTRENILARPRSYRTWLKCNRMWLSWTTDERWLNSHAFYVTKLGRLTRNRNYCEPAFMAD